MAAYEPSKLADVALALIAQGAIKADDESLAVASAARRMLRSIQTGEMVLVRPEAPPAVE